jgi:glutathione S-transferase
MAYRLYGEPGSGAGIVEVALVATGAPYEWSPVSLGEGEQRSAEYVRLNPQRKLPTLVTPQGEILTETSAIAIVLDERHPAARLFPSIGSPERAQALRWLMFVAAELYPLVEINDYPERFAPDASSVDGMRELARRIWRERWLVLEAQIAGDPWLLVSGFCFTDVYLASVSRWAQQDAWRPGNIPRIEAIAAAVAALPSLGLIWQRHFASDA